MTENVQAQAAEAAKTTEPAASTLEKTITFSVSSEELTAGIEASVKKYAKRAKMPGFRAGHVPMSTVRAMYGHDAYVDTLNKLVEREFEKAAKEAQLSMVGMPKITPENAQEENPKELKFKAVVECYPEFELPSLEALELKRFNCPVTEENVQQTIEVMRKQRVKFEVEEGRKAQDEDAVTVDFKGTKDGVAFEGGTAQGVRYFLGKQMMLPEFDAAVRGLAVGESKDFDLTFPKEYQAKELAGATVQFHVELKKLEKPVYPEVDEAFAKAVGLDTVAELQSEVRRNLEREVKFRLINHTKEGVMDELNKINTFALPTEMVAEEIAQMQARTAQQYKQYSGEKKVKVPEIPNAIFEPEARRRVRLGILTSKIIEANKIVVTEDDAKALLDEMAQAYEEPEAYKKQYLANPQTRSMLMNLTLENKVVDFVLGKAKTTEETIGFDKLMAKA